MTANRFPTFLLLSVIWLCHHAQASEQGTNALTLALDADLSAVAVEGGEAIRAGMEIAIEEINNRGGVLGRPLVLKTFDHRGNPARGERNIEKIAKLEGVLAVFGGVHTPVALAELDKIHKYNLLFMVPWAAGTSIVDNNRVPNNVFRVSIRDQEAGEVLIRHAHDRGIKRIALILERTGWGRSNQSSLTRAAGENQLNIVSTQWINWRQTDFRTEMNAIIESGAEAIILVSNAPEATVVSKTLIASQATSIPLISHWGITGGDFRNSLKPEELSSLDISVIQTFSFVGQNNARARFLLEQYQKRYPQATSASIHAAVGIAHSYDLVHLLARATELAASTDVDKVRHALENLPPLQGAVKHYAPAFTSSLHDALLAEDYFMTTFDNNGDLVPLPVQP